jgi:DNA polymerase
MKILIVGEAYGDKESMFNHPFVGPAGRELANMLADAGLAPAHNMRWPNELDMIAHWKMLKRAYSIELALVFPVQPEDNNVELFFGAKKEDVCLDMGPLKPGAYLRKAYRPYYDELHELIKTEKPNLVITVGVTPTWALTGQQKIAGIRGTVIWNPVLKTKILPTWHPAAVLRQWSLRAIAIADLMKAKKESEYPEVKRTKRYILVDPSFAEMKEWLDQPAKIFSVDIETGYALFSKTEIERMKKQQPHLVSLLAGQISMIGFARSSTEAMVIPFMARRELKETEIVGELLVSKRTLNYWDNPDDEIEAWRLALYGLKKPVPKLFQNGVFDISRLLCAAMRLTQCYEDTMLYHHALFPELQKGLGFLGSLYTDEPAWKGMLHHGESIKRDE